MYEQTSFDFARAYWHWFLLVRPAPFPETLIRADPDLYLKQTIGARSAGLAPFTAAAYAEYLRCLSDPGYRARHLRGLPRERDDRPRTRPRDARIHGSTSPVRFPGVVGRARRDRAVLRSACRMASVCAATCSGEALPCGHYIPEEAPELTARTRRCRFSHRVIPCPTEPSTRSSSIRISCRVSTNTTCCCTSICI